MEGEVVVSGKSKRRRGIEAARDARQQGYVSYILSHWEDGNQVMLTYRQWCHPEMRLRAGV